MIPGASSRRRNASTAPGWTEPIGSVFSPDGQWIAYHVRPRDSDARDADRGAFVQRFPAASLPQQLPKISGDFHPVWTAGGKELVYVSGAVLNQWAAVAVTTSPSLSFGTPTRFTSSVQDRISTDRRNFDVLPDGRFIGVALADSEDSGAATRPREIRIALNWFEELKSRAGSVALITEPCGGLPMRASDRSESMNHRWSFTCETLTGPRLKAFNPVAPFIRNS